MTNISMGSADDTLPSIIQEKEETVIAHLQGQTTIDLRRMTEKDANENLSVSLSIRQQARPE